MTGVRRSLIGVVLGLWLGAPSPAIAQGLEFFAAALVANPHSVVDIAGVREETDGVWFGGVLALRYGRFAVGGVGMVGDLKPDSAGTALERDGGEVGGYGSFAVTPWLGVELSYQARAFSSAAGYQRWDIWGLGVALSTDLGSPAFRAFARLAWLPSVSVEGFEGPDVSVRAETGFTLTPDRWPLVLRFAYRVERYDFTGGSLQRLEQFEYFSLTAGVKLRRDL